MHTLASIQPHELGAWIPFIAIPSAIIIVFISLYFRHQRRRLWHETARIALEKGQPVPLQLTDIQTSGKYRANGTRSPFRDLRCALILLAVSGGLYLGLKDNGPQALIGCYITGGIGIALLINALITALFAPKSPEIDPRPPQA